MKKYIYQIIIVLLLSSFGCKQNNSNKKNKEKPKTEEKAVVYTCPMHPQVREDKPGKCPMCQMDLVPMKKHKKEASKPESQPITLTKREILLGNIHTEKPTYGKLSNKITLTGKTSFSPGKTSAIASDISGWIEKMYVNNPGEKIKKGEKIYDIYSPNLLSDEKNYLTALKNDSLSGVKQMLEALKQKLQRWGLSEKQIETLKDETTLGYTSIYSDRAGYMTAQYKKQGDKVKKGEAVLQLSQGQNLWVEAELYNKDLSLVDKIKNIIIRPMDNPSIKLKGKLVFNNPVNQANSIVHKLKIAIQSPKQILQSGMPVYVDLITSANEAEILVPNTAVINEKGKKYLWLQTDSNTFKRKTIIAGIRSQNQIQILSGIDENAKIVNAGSYLINSAYTLQYGSGANLSGMQMSDMKMGGRSK